MEFQQNFPVDKLTLLCSAGVRLCKSPLNDYGFLKGKGGYSDEHEYRQVVEITADGQPTLYADPSGSSYCRYLGIEVN